MLLIGLSEDAGGFGEENMIGYAVSRRTSKMLGRRRIPRHTAGPPASFVFAKISASLVSSITTKALEEPSPFAAKYPALDVNEFAVNAPTLQMTEGLSL